MEGTCSENEKLFVKLEEDEFVSEDKISGKEIVVLDHNYEISEKLAKSGIEGIKVNDDLYKLNLMVNGVSEKVNRWDKGVTIVETVDV